MAACSKSVNFPIRKLFESIPGLSPEDDAFSALKNPYVSDDTQQLFSIMIDRMDEQLRACGVYEARYDNNFRMITKEKYNYISKVRVHHDAGFRELLNYETHRQYMNGIKFSFQKRSEDSEGVLDLDFGDKSWTELIFQMNTQTKAIRISEIKSRHLKRVLDFFDPRGTGYEFFTPDELERYAARFPTPESRQGHNLMSPELRHYRTVPSMLSMLRRNFDANQYPDQTEAFKAYETRMRRDEDDDQGGDNKRRRMEWAVGANGYEVQLGIL